MSDSLYQQDTDLAVVLALAAHVAHRTFVDVGAEKGGFSRALMERGFRGVLFEPYPAHRMGLEQLVSGTASRMFPFAIDELDHEGLLHLAVDADDKPLDYFHSLHRDEANPHARHSRAISVPCRSLGSLAEEGVIDAATGIIKIDTEGNDLNVIKGLGRASAEVLVCEFVTPRLFPSWSRSFPEALVEAARERGYEECIAVKRFGLHEIVSINPAGFADGQWGNLVFTSRSLLALAREEIVSLAVRDEKRLVEAIEAGERSLQEKEKAIHEKEEAIQALARACDERLAVVVELNAEVEKCRVKELQLRQKIERLQNREP